MQAATRHSRAATCIRAFRRPGLLGSTVFADDIDGVQPAALDQPRVNVVVRRGRAGPPLIAGDGATFNVEAFLDTGASSIALSAHTAQQLGINREMSGTSEARFQDVGVGGGSEFAISEPLFLSIAPMTPSVDTDDKNTIAMTYGLTAGPFRTEIGPLGGMDFLTELAAGDLDILGMPVIAGKIVVMDAHDVNAMTDKIRTYVYDAKTAESSRAPIPKTSLHIRLGYASFAPFTKTSPPGAVPPAIWANPLVGPNPLNAPNFQRDSARLGASAIPPLTICHAGKRVSGSWLLDTGAAVSMISRKSAAALGVTYVPDTDGTSHPKLAGPGTSRQFIMTVGGIGGSKKSAGFFLDSLSLPTVEQRPIVFHHAPVLVADITVSDPANHSFTLDGVLGMNFLVASAMVDEGTLIPDIDRLTPGAFRFIVLDQPKGLLGLERN